MGDCVYCGKPVGFMRSKHAECEREHQEEQALLRGAGGQLVQRLRNGILGSQAMPALEADIRHLAKSSGIADYQMKPLLVNAFGKAVEDALMDDLLSQQEELRLLQFMGQFRLGQDDLNKSGAFGRLVKSAVLRDLLEGKIPRRITFTTDLGVNLQKSESVLWVFEGTRYYEDKIRRETVGRTQGVSIRVMKGVYYRVGGFRGRPVETQERRHIGDGRLVVTTKHMYFVSPQKSVRVPFAKIISFEPYEDGLGLTRDAANALPQTFVTGDGWFSFNLVSNVAQLD